MYRHQFEVNVTFLKSESGSMLRNQHVTSKITKTDQKAMFMPAGIYNTQLSSLK